MPRIKLDIAYDGSNFAGWQVQDAGAHSPTTVQGELEKAIAKILCCPVRLHGAGRTDSGVHADMQCAHFDAPERARRVNWVQALPRYLPHSIAVTAFQVVDDNFHARFSAKGKVYTYSIWTGTSVVSPRLRPFVWDCGVVNLAAMHEAAQALCGRHDFASFQNTGTTVLNTIRTIYAISSRTASMPFLSDFSVQNFSAYASPHAQKLANDSASPTDAASLTPGAHPATASITGVCLTGTNSASSYNPRLANHDITSPSITDKELLCSDANCEAASSGFAPSTNSLAAKPNSPDLLCQANGYQLNCQQVNADVAAEQPCLTGADMAGASSNSNLTIQAGSPGNMQLPQAVSHALHYATSQEYGSPLICWQFYGNGFLKQMVRNMMGFLVFVGREKLTPQNAIDVLNAQQRNAFYFPTAPACGLSLTKVLY